MKPILFNTQMVQAILEGRKTVTRRCVKPRFEGRYYPIWDYPERLIFEKPTDPYDWWQIWIDHKGSPYTCTKPPYFVGDILYVRETWAKVKGESRYLYKADKVDFIYKELHSSWKWKPSIHMPKEAARIFLRVTNVLVAKLQDITTKDMQKEGLTSMAVFAGDKEIARQEWALLWNSTIPGKDYNKYCFSANPWVWVIEFERTEKPNE